MVKTRRNDYPTLPTVRKPFNAPRQWVKKAGVLVNRPAARGRPRKVIPSTPAAKNDRISKRWPSRINDRNTKGLNNPDNVCYRNSMLQCLIHQPSIFDYLGNMHQNCEQNSTQCVVCALQALLQSYWNYPYQPAPAALPAEAVQTLHDAISNTVNPAHPFYVDAINISAQADSWEFLGYLLDEIRGKQRRNGVQFERMFVVRHWSSWTCQDCGREHRTNNGNNAAMYGMSVGISHPGQDLDLTDYVHALHNDTVRLQCDSAGCRDIAAKNRQRRLSIWQAPQVLFIRLQLFEFRREETKNKKGKLVVNYVPVKLCQEVPYDETLTCQATLKPQSPMPTVDYFIVSTVSSYTLATGLTAAIISLL